VKKKLEELSQVINQVVVIKEKSEFFFSDGKDTEGRRTVSRRKYENLMKPTRNFAGNHEDRRKIRVEVVATMKISQGKKTIKIWGAGKRSDDVDGPEARRKKWLTCVAVEIHEIVCCREIPMSWGLGDRKLDPNTNTKK